MIDDYDQPEFYRFNQDSLLLVSWVKSRGLKAESVLDLGSGCGIIGCELGIHLMIPAVTLLEIQKECRPYIEKNAHRFLPASTKIEIITASFSEWRTEKRYELVVCNPPYYLPGSGKQSPDPRRAQARFFIKDNWSELLDCIHRSLTADGKAFVVLKNDKTLVEHVSFILRLKSLQASFFDQGDIVFLELSRLDID